MPRKQTTDDKPLSIEEARSKIAKTMSDLVAGNYSGPISFRLKPTKKPSETYPLKLTWHQRDSLIHCTRIKNKIKERLQEAGEGTQIVGVTRKELDHLNDEIGTAAVYAPSPHKKRLVAVLHKVAELFASDRVGLFGEETPKTRKTAPKKGDLLYQFKITLLDIKPAIWRRIQVPDCTLAEINSYHRLATTIGVRAAPLSVFFWRSIMKSLSFGFLIVGALLTAIATCTSAGDTKDEAIKKDRTQTEGTWRVVALEVDGNKTNEEDAKKLTVVFGADGTWSLRADGKEVSKGTSTIDPTKKPKSIDFSPTEGEGKGDVHLGIYELGENTRKLCFAPPGKERPTEFSSRPGSEHLLMTFEREKAK